jgi:hypothetical protein
MKSGKGLSPAGENACRRGFDQNDWTLLRSYSETAANSLPGAAVLPRLRAGF